MAKKRGTLRMFLALLVGTGIFSVLGCRTEGGPQSGAAPTDWLKGTEEDRFRQVEAHLRGFDVAMIEVGYRFGELYFAGKDRNWPYAKYQAEKIETAVKLALERRPKRADSTEPFLREEVPAILRAIEKREDQVFQQGMERLRASCMRCHVAEKLPDLTVEFPEQRLSPIRRAR